MVLKLLDLIVWDMVVVDDVMIVQVGYVVWLIVGGQIGGVGVGYVFIFVQFVLYQGFVVGFIDVDIDVEVFVGQIVGVVVIIDVDVQFWVLGGKLCDDWVQMYDVKVYWG